MVEVNYGQYTSPFTEPRNKPAAFGKETRDLDNAQDTWRNARDIGSVRLNHSRLNIFTELSVKDSVDHFKFNVTSPGPLYLGGWNDDTVHVQMLNDRGRVIADSNKDAGDSYDTFKAMTQPGGLEDFKPGDYTLRVQRLEGDDGAEKLPYSLQLQMGEKIKNDYDTTEYAGKSYSAVSGVTPDDPMAHAKASPSTLAAQAIGSMIDETNTHLTNVLNGAYDLFPPIR